MKLDEKDIIKHELIGLEAEVIDSKNKSDIGVRGKIIDETQNTIVIIEKEKKKTLFKKNITLKMYIKGREIMLKGKCLFGRPKERVQK